MATAIKLVKLDDEEGEYNIIVTGDTELKIAQDIPSDSTTLIRRKGDKFAFNVRVKQDSLNRRRGNKRTLRAQMMRDVLSGRQTTLG